MSPPSRTMCAPTRPWTSGRRCTCAAQINTYMGPQLSKELDTGHRWNASGRASTIWRRRSRRLSRRERRRWGITLLDHLATPADHENALVAQRKQAGAYLEQPKRLKAELSSPGGRLPWLLEPHLEERVQVHAAVALRESDELRGRHRTEPVPLRPVAHDPEERLIPHLLAQGLKRHAAAVVDGAVEQVDRGAGIAGGRVPEPVGTGGRVVQLHEELVSALVALVLAPDPLRPRREAFVEPDVRPLRERHRIAVPHVRQLVDQGRLVGHVGEHRLSLGLERVAHPRGFVNDGPDGGERIRSVD